MNRLDKIKAKYEKLVGELAMRKRDKKVERVQTPPLELTFIETCKLQKKAALDFFNVFFRMVTEGRCDYELIAQEALG